MASSTYYKCKKPSCACQRFRPKESIPNECFYCDHSIGYHESKIVNSAEYPYGPCNQAQCGCQRFKNQDSNRLLCIHCNHYDGFHSDWPISTRYTKISRNILVNTLICLDQETPNTIPKVGSRLWNDLDSRNLIKKSIEIPNNLSSAEIYNLVFNLFSDHLFGQGWCLFNSSSGTLKKVSYNEITYELIKQNLTKEKKMYIAPDTFDLGFSDFSFFSDTVLLDYLVI